MTTEIKENLVRVVILAIDNIYTQIYDELYCSKQQYNEILSEFGESEKYKIVII